jgi:hypothetical protein
MVNDVQVAAMLEKRRRLQGKALSCISTSQHNPSRLMCDAAKVAAANRKK